MTGGVVIDEQCEACGHAFAPHVLIPVAFSGSGHDLPVAGYVVGPHDECECVSVWSVKNDRLPTFDVAPMTKVELVAAGLWR